MRGKNGSGRVLVLEGTDGTGKRTQAQLLATKIIGLDCAIEYHTYPNPHSIFGRIIYSHLRNEWGNFEKTSPLLIALLFSFDRGLDRKSIVSALRNGAIVVLNRYLHSNTAHGGAKCETDSQAKLLARIVKLMERQVLGLPEPDLTFFLNLPPEVALNLLKQRADATSQSTDAAEENLQHQLRAYTIYQRLCETEPNWRNIACLTEEQQLRSPEDIHFEIWAHIERVLPDYVEP